MPRRRRHHSGDFRSCRVHERDTTQTQCGISGQVSGCALTYSGCEGANRISGKGVDCMSDCGVPASRLLGDITRYLGVAQTSSLTHAQRHQPVTGISQDSRSVRPGDLYIALPGRTHHGGAFAAEAAARGAVAMISDRSTDALPSIVIDEPRRMLGPLATWFHQEPSRSLDVYAVTGTNGKTSSAYLLDAGLVGAGHLTGMISGVDVRGPDGSRTAHHTTPEASEVHRTLAGFVQGKVRTVTMEVSSHALALHRVDGTIFRVAVFTNLSRDHLDFHSSMEAYFDAKTKLFDPERCRAAAIGIDDEYGRRLASSVAVPHVTFSTRDDTAGLYATEVKADHRGTSFLVHRGETTRRARLQLLGEHQVDNALAALAALSIGGVDLGDAVRGDGKTRWRAGTTHTRGCGTEFPGVRRLCAQFSGTAATVSVSTVVDGRQDHRGLRCDRWT